MFNANTKGKQMTAAEQLTAFATEYAKQVSAVRAEYDKQSLGAMQRLMARTNQTNAQDAIHEEARQRMRRNLWAAATSRAA